MKCKNCGENMPISRPLLISVITEGVVIVFLLFAIFIITNTSSTDLITTQINSTRPTEKEISYGFLDYRMFNNYLTDGTYKCGSDFEPDDYYIFSLYGAEALYDVCDNPNDFSWSNHRIVRKVSAKKGQYVRLPAGTILVPSKEIDTNNLKKYGIFLVGVDLPEGSYKLTSVTDKYNTELRKVSGVAGAYQISNDGPDSEPEYCSPLFDEQTYVSVRDGQYIVINNARMTLEDANASNTGK